MHSLVFFAVVLGVVSVVACVYVAVEMMDIPPLVINAPRQPAGSVGDVAEVD